MFNIIKSIMGKGKNTRLRVSVKQKQKMSYRTVALIASSCITMLIIGWIIFFNVARVDKTMAKETQKIFIGDQVFINDMTLPAPIVNTSQAPDENTMMMRKAKGNVE